MATYGQGSPGVRIRLRDASAVNLVTNPRITAGIVGYASKGELNKILTLTSTADQDTLLGNGYNNSKFNQGLYASRAVINGGGFVEFVRPYGEEIITDDQDADYSMNQELKTDAYVVQYDFSTDATTSFDIGYFAATRYMTDGMGSLGTRKINTITETIANNKNVDFELDADADGDKVALFAIMNTDPTAANRAGDRVVINSIAFNSYTSPSSTIMVTTASPHNYSNGDTVIIANTTNYNTTAAIVTITGAMTFTYTIAGDLTGKPSEMSGITVKNSDTVDSGVDYVSVKTVASGKASKKLDYFELVGGSKVITVDNSGETFTVADGNNVDHVFELVDSDGGEEVTGDNIQINIVYDTFTAPASLTDAIDSFTDIDVNADTLTISNTPTVWVNGDTVQFTTSGALPTGISASTTYKLANVTATTTTLTDLNGAAIDITAVGTGIQTMTKVGNTITVVTGTKFVVNDVISFTSNNVYPTGLLPNTDYMVSAVSGNSISITLDGEACVITDAGNGVHTVYNQSALIRNIINGMTSIGYAKASGARGTFDGSLVNSVNNTIKLATGAAYNYSIDDYVVFNDATTSLGTSDVSDLFEVGQMVAGNLYKIAAIDLANDTIKIKTIDGTLVYVSTPSSTSTLFKILNVTKGVVSAIVNDGNRLRIDIIGTLGLTVPSSIQDIYTGFVKKSTELTDYINYESNVIDTLDETSDGIVLDNTVGRTFLSLGLAIEDYQDINFDGSAERIFTLTDDGVAVARMYLFVTYYFGGESYSFSGTIIPYVHNDLNLEIQQQAEAVANGWEFVLNQSITLEDALLDPNFDLSQSLSNGNISGAFTQISFNANDPAITNDAVWEYDPRNNGSSATLADAWKLFLNKDEASADMLVSAGTAISNLFIKGMEQINYNVMDTMLDICEKRKDLFAIFDGVDEPKIDVALRKMVGIGSQGDISRWGALFDGRSIFFDTVYTKLNVQAVKSIEVAAIITLNRAANVYWLPPAGFETGRIPAALASKQKFIRTYNFPDDPTSDIARLYDANINPTRANDQGMFIYGQKTMLKRLTALNRLNVIMLVAGIHKRFANFLDRKVFQLNTPALRTSITAELQTQLELIKSANPAGLTEGIVICDETNNTPDIIDTNQLIVDIFLQPSRTAEFITLRTTVQRTGDTATITGATIIGG